nr:PREDICTED: serine protease snake-like [Bemisia tabaci]
MVALAYKNRGRLGYYCGGTLISENFVLTAAHCIGTSLGDPVQVRLGELILNNEDDGASPVDVRVERTIVHPDYRDDRKYNDIALIRLERKVTFSASIRPSCLHQGGELHRLPEATGWGYTEFGGKRSDALQKVKLDVINNTQCDQLYDAERREPNRALERGIIETMLCAGKLDGGADTCQGDSGGPFGLPSRDNVCQHVIVGVTSFGKFCGQENSPGVYTRVSSYLPWIENIVWSGEQ